MSVPPVEIIDAGSFEKLCSEAWLRQVRSLRDTLRKHRVDNNRSRQILADRFRSAMMMFDQRGVEWDGAKAMPKPVFAHEEALLNDDAHPLLIGSEGYRFIAVHGLMHGLLDDLMRDGA